MRLLSALIGVGLVFLPSVSLAASLQVAPVSLEIPIPARNSALVLHNFGTVAIDAQVRVFRWRQVDGQEQLVPATEVVASPPAVSLSPDQDYVVRLVRTTTAPLQGEEGYRILIDELSGPPEKEGSVVRLAFRYSVPAFFVMPGSRPLVQWSASQENGKLTLSARNDGDRYLRIAGMTATCPDGTKIAFGNGLVGYVLARSSNHWTASGVCSMPFTAVSVVATSNDGQINAQAAFSSAAQ